MLNRQKRIIVSVKNAEEGPRVLFYTLPPSHLRCHFRQLWIQIWEGGKKSICSPDHKALRRGLYCSCAQRENYHHPGPPWGPADEERRRRREEEEAQKEEEEMMCVDGQNGRMDGKVWAGFGTATRRSGRRVEMSH